MGNQVARDARRGNGAGEDDGGEGMRGLWHFGYNPLISRKFGDLHGVFTL
jgi:hypothetical protein